MENSEKVLTCPKCNKTLPLTTEHWKPNKSTKSGWSLTMCRQCFNAYYREYSRNNPEWRREKERKYKERNPEKYAAKRKRCHEKAKAEGKNKYCNRNIEKCRERDKKRWRENEARRKWDAERWKKRKANGYNEHERNRYKENPLPKIIKVNKRRALKINAKGSHNEQLLRWKYEYYGKRCYYCKKDIGLNELTEDHRIPLSKGGTDWISNIVPACLNCNSRKGNKTEKEYKIWILNNKFKINKVVVSPDAPTQTLQ
jgi:5-methylcytosine-specific restriction endonuclease McrA